MWSARFSAALIIRDHIDEIERHSDGPRKFGADLGIEVRVRCFQVHAWPAQAGKSDPVGIVEPGRNKTGGRDAPVVVAFGPTQEGDHRGIGDGRGRVRYIELPIDGQGTGKSCFGGGPDFRVSACHGKAERAAKNLFLRYPRQRRDIGDAFKLKARARLRLNGTRRFGARAT